MNLTEEFQVTQETLDMTPIYVDEEDVGSGRPKGRKTWLEDFQQRIFFASYVINHPFFLNKFGSNLTPSEKDSEYVNFINAWKVRMI